MLLSEESGFMQIASIMHAVSSVVILRPWSRDSSALEFILSRSWSRDLKAKVSVLVSRPEDPGLSLGLKKACLQPTPVAQLPLFVASLRECSCHWNRCSQCCDFETMVSRLECTRVHFVLVSVSVSRPEDQGLGLGLETYKKVLTTTLAVSN